MESQKQILEAVFRTALRAVDPADLLRERLGKIPSFRRLFVVGGGKAAASMAATMEEFFSGRIEAGCVAVKKGQSLDLKKIEVLETGHPNPDERSARAARKILQLLNGLTPEDLVVALISGGASSLLALPKKGSIEEFSKENEKLLGSGLPIEQINRRRRELLVLADGGLARAAAPARVISFILSDVIGSDLAAIGSGPTFHHALEPERVRNILIGDNALAVGGAAHAVKRFGFKPELVLAPWSGEASEAGRQFAKRLLQIKPGTALIAGGETTVTLGKNPGKGGRCQEAALAAALELEGQSNVSILFAGTDGGDGPTDAAGAFVDGGSLARSRKMGLIAEDHLRLHDSHAFFESLGDLLRTGPTGTNVADLAIGIRQD